MQNCVESQFLTLSNSVAPFTQTEAAFALLTVLCENDCYGFFEQKKTKLFSWVDVSLISSQMMPLMWSWTAPWEDRSVWKQTLVLLYWVLCEGRLVANQLSSLHVQLSGFNETFKNILKKCVSWPSSGSITLFWLTGSDWGTIGGKVTSHHCVYTQSYIKKWF